MDLEMENILLSRGMWLVFISADLSVFWPCELMLTPEIIEKLNRPSPTTRDKDETTQFSCAEPHV